MSILKPIHVAVIDNIMSNILLINAETWPCRGCGHAENSGLSEVCNGCHREFLDDGRTARDFDANQYRA